MIISMSSIDSAEISCRDRPETNPMRGTPAVAEESHLDITKEAKVPDVDLQLAGDRIFPS